MVMPRFFFHIDDGVFVIDDEGTELPDENAARDQAVAAAGTILNDLDGAFWRGASAWRMHVTDEANCLLFTLRFSSDIPSAKVTFLPQHR
jgi:hypothetical protein